MALDTTYKNRIVGFDEIDPREIKFNPSNPNDHPDFQKQVMGEILDSIGWIQTVIINKTTGNLVDGEMRVRDAISHNEKTVPVTYVELSEEQEREAILMFTQIGKLARTNQTNLTAIINSAIDRSKNTSDFVRQVAARNKIDMDKLVDNKTVTNNKQNEEDNKKQEEDKNPEDFVDEKWKLVVAIGQLWELGSSRLFIGDSLVKENLDVLFNGKQCNAIVTDPPYGVKFVRGQFITDEKRKFKKGTKPVSIQGDNLVAKDQQDFIKASFDVFLPYGVELSPIYMFVANLQEGAYSLLGFIDAGIHLQGQLVWVKGAMILGQCDYQWKHEICYYGWKPGKGAHPWYGGRDKVTAIDFPKIASTFHPNEKPVGLLEQMIANSTKDGEIVFDPFVGSGSTVIASENLHRVCYACEKDLLYAAYTLQRFEKERGIVPVLKDIE